MKQEINALIRKYQTDLLVMPARREKTDEELSNGTITQFDAVAIHAMTDILEEKAKEIIKDLKTLEGLSI